MKNSTLLVIGRYMFYQSSLVLIRNVLTYQVVFLKNHFFGKSSVFGRAIFKEPSRCPRLHENAISLFHGRFHTQKLVFKAQNPTGMQQGTLKTSKYRFQEISVSQIWPIRDLIWLLKSTTLVFMICQGVATVSGLNQTSGILKVCY